MWGAWFLASFLHQTICNRYTVRGFDDAQSLLDDRGWPVPVVDLHGRYRKVSYELFAGTQLVKPASFQTASLTLGFMLNGAY
jgi:hemolysin activation/secretion protein